MFGIHKKDERKKENKSVEETMHTNKRKNVSVMVNIDPFLLAYAREKYGPGKETPKSETTETL